MMQLERNEFEEEAGLGYKYIYIYIIGLTRPCRNPWPRGNERHDPSDIFH